MKAMIRGLTCGAALAASTAAWADRPQWGGIGYMTQGFVLGDVSGLGDSLGVDHPPGLGLVLGGGGLALLGGRVVLGGTGYALSGLDGEGEVASARFGGGGGGFNIGYAVVNSGRMLLFPFVGAVGHGGHVLVENGSDPAIVGGFDLLGGERKGFEGGGWALDFGASVFQLMWGEDSGGLAVGGAMGFWLPISGDGWTATDGGAATGLQGTPSGLYFRLQLGGGGASGG